MEEGEIQEEDTGDVVVPATTDRYAEFERVEVEEPVEVLKSHCDMTVKLCSQLKIISLLIW